jgi:hypothetical protein
MVKMSASQARDHGFEPYWLVPGSGLESHYYKFQKLVIAIELKEVCLNQ